MTKPTVTIRPYEPSDTQAIAELFYNTIHTINIRDYSQAQVDVWAPEKTRHTAFWEERWRTMAKPLVAVAGDEVVGFTEFEANGHIDCFYVHHAWQGKGVGSTMMAAIDTQALTQNIPRIYAEVSLTARSFFESKGFSVVEEQRVVRDEGVELTRFVMEKQAV